MGIKASIRSQVRKTSFKKMKIAALVSVVAAGRQARDAQSLFNKMLGDHNNNVEQRNFVFSETDSLYQIFQFYMGNKGQDFSKVDDMLSYGCWCQIRNEEAQGIVTGHGAPVDELDAACKRWHQCRACTTVDFSTDGACIPNEIAYEVGFDPITMRIDCQFNKDECSTMNCGCDEQMAFTLTELFAGGQFQEEFLTLTDGSGFDHASQCHAPTPNPDNGNGNGSDGSDTEGGNGTNGGNTNGGNGDNSEGGDDAPVVEELQCCGTYPNRFEFLTHGGRRSCCGEVTYNTNRHDCCAGGFLGAIGTCASR